MPSKEKKELLKRKQKLETRLRKIEESGILDDEDIPMPCELSDILDELHEISLKINKLSN